MFGDAETRRERRRREGDRRREARRRARASRRHGSLAAPWADAADRRRGADRAASAWARHLLPIMAAGAIVVPGAALANPSGGTVVAGGATINHSGSTTTITQSSQKAIINWKDFSIGAGELTQFLQPGSNSIVLNRVTGGQVSQILGTLKANGNVILVNPNGVFFGHNSRVDVGGIIASTADISNRDFMAGRMNFSVAGKADATIVNKGSITVRDAGVAAFVAPGVDNQGIIVAQMGKVSLASGNSFTIDLHGDGLVHLAVNDKVSKDVFGDGSALVKNSGRITADGGRVLITANAAKNVVDNVINMSGVVQARGVRQNADGSIDLFGTGGGVDVSGTLDASNARGKGGRVTVTGDRVHLRASARVDVSGRTGGGHVRIGGDYQGGAGTLGTDRRIPNATRTRVDRGAVINADATHTGDGGRVIVWADDTTSFYGLITARGGAESGDGGFVEVSGKNTLTFDGLADRSAVNGKSGTLLLDPTTLNIVLGAAGVGEISYATLNANLGLGDLILMTSAGGTGTGDGTISFETGGTVDMSGNKLTIVADNDLGGDIAAGTINIMSGVQLINGMVEFQAGTVNLHSTIGATIVMAAVNAPGQVNVFGGASIQDGIDIVGIGGTVTVGVGTFVENLVIGKAITLEGAQAGVAAPTRLGFETILTSTGGAVISLVAGSAGATIDGFTIDVSGGATRGIESFGGPLDGLTIQNNIVNAVDGAAIFLNDPGIDITVHQNLFDAAGHTFAGGVVHLDTDNFDGFHFTANYVLNGDTGFFVDGNHNVGTSVNRSVLFHGNLFEGNQVGANMGRFAVEFATISQNVFHDNVLDGLQGGIQNSTIIANSFTFNGRAGLRLTGFGGTGDPTRGAQNNLITQNRFNNNGLGGDPSGHGDIRLDDQFDGTQSTNVFFSNSMGSTIAVFNNETSGEIINFSGNWWSLANVAAIQARHAGAGAADIDFSPFLHGGGDTDLGTPGFQGDFSVLDVTAASAQFGPVGRIQEGIDLVTAGGLINLLAGTYAEGPQIVVHKDVTIVGAGIGVAIVNPTADTGAAGDARGWWLVNAGIDFNLSNVTLDGDGFLVWQAIRHLGTGTIDSVNFTNILYNASGPEYQGTAVAAFGGVGAVDVVNSMFSNIGRVGVIYLGAGTTGLFENNTYVGKGAGDHLDYAVEVGAGAVVTIRGNDISNNLGVAMDGSVSAGIRITTFFGPGSAAIVEDNILTNNHTGIAVGVGPADSSTITLLGTNTITGGTTGISFDGAGVVLTGNSFGTTAFAGQSGDYIDLGSGAFDNTFLDASTATFEGFAGSTYTRTGGGGGTGFDLERRITHGPDDPSVGTVIWDNVTDGKNNLFVVTGGTIQNAIDVVNILVAGGPFSINVEAGTYNENLIITGNEKAGTMLVAQFNAGIGAKTDPGGRGAETIITAAAGTLITVDANDIMIDGFTLDGQGTATTGVAVTPFTSGADIRNNFVTGFTGTGIALDNAEAFLVLDNAISNVHTGVSMVNNAIGTVDTNLISASNTGILVQDITISDVFHLTDNMVAAGVVGLSFQNVDGAAVHQVSGNMITGNPGATGIEIRNSTSNITFTDTSIANVSIGVDLGTATNDAIFIFQGGLTISTVSGPGIVADGNGGHLVIADTGMDTTTISATGGAALDLANMAVDITVDSLSSTDSTGNGLRIVNVLSINALTGIFVNDGTTVTNSAGTGILVSGSGTQIEFGKTTVDKSATAGRGVELIMNSGAMTFSDLAVTTSNGTGLLVDTSTGMVVVQNAMSMSTIDATGGAALHVVGTLVDLTFESLSSTNSASEGVLLNVASGSLTVNLTTTVSGAAFDGIFMTGNNAALILGDTTVTNSAGTGILAIGNQGSIDFGKTSVDKSATVGRGVDLQDNQATVAFSDLSVTTMDGAGLFASNNSGTVTVQNATGMSTIDATGGAALEIFDTMFDLTFASTSSSASANWGIFIMGSTGPLTILGGTIDGSALDGFHVAGGAMALDLSGLTIQNTTGHGLVVDGAGHSLAGNSFNDLVFTNIGMGAMDYIRLTGGAFDDLFLDAKNVTFDGFLGSTYTRTGGGGGTGFDLERRIFHGVDDAAQGVVVWDMSGGKNNLFVVTGGSIQDAVDVVDIVASGGMLFTINVEAGTYNENVVITGAEKDGTMLVAQFNAGIGAKTNPGGRGAETVITAAGGVLITIGSNDIMVDGFTLDGAGGATHGVVAANVSGTDIRNNIVQGVNFGIDFTTVTGFTILDNDIDVVVLGITVLDDSFGQVNTNLITAVTTGISVSNSTAPGTLSFDGNMISAGFVGIVFFDVDGTGTYSVSNTMITGTSPNSTGIQILDSAGDIGFGNTSIANVSEGMLLSSNTGAYTFQNGLTIAAVTGNGIRGISGGTLIILDTAMTTTTVTAVGGAALKFFGGTVDMTFDSLSSTNSASEGIFMFAVTGTGATGGLFVNGTTTISGPANQGMWLLQNDGAFAFGDTTVTNSGGTGILAQGNMGSLLFGKTVVDKSATAGTGVELTTNAAAITFDDLGITTSNGTGFLAADNTGLTTVSNTTGMSFVDTALGVAVDISTSDIDMTWRSIDGDGGGALTGGIFIVASSGSFTVTGVAGKPDGGTLNGYAGNGIFVHDFAGDLSLSRMAVTNMSGAGILLDNVSGTTLLSDIRVDTTLTAGVQLVNFGGTAAAILDGVMIANAGTNGLFILAFGGGASVTATDTMVTGSGGIGVFVTSYNSAAAASFTNTTIDGALLFGLHVNSSSGSATFNNTSVVNAPDAVAITNNTGVYSFDLGLTIVNDGGTGFQAIDGGTVNVVGGANVNTIDTTNGAAVNVLGTAIDMTFQSLSSTNAAASGILVGGGSTGSFTVTGLGNGPGDKGSGGTIDLAGASGIFIEGLATVSLTSMTVTNSGTTGVLLQGVLTSALVDNLTVDQSATVGILVLDFAPGASASLVNNMVANSGTIGILLDGFSGGSVLTVTGSMVSGAGTGVYLGDVSDATATLTGNMIDGVNDGITLTDVVDSVVDLTGNTVAATNIGVNIVDGVGSTFTVGGEIAGTATGVNVLNTMGPGFVVNFDGLDVMSAVGGTGIRLTTAGAGAIASSYDGVRLTGGLDGLVIDGPNQSIVGNSLNDTVFVGQAGNYIAFLNGALFAPDNPTVIDAGDASFDGVLGRNLSDAEKTTVSGKILDFNDTGDVGLIFFGAPAVPDAPPAPVDLILTVTERAAIQAETYGYRELKCGPVRASFGWPAAGPYVFNAFNPGCPIGEAPAFAEANLLLSGFWQWYRTYYLKN